jgi:hypothetical protein
MSTHQTVDLPKGFIVQAPPGKQFHDGEPVIVFRGQDELMGYVLRCYMDELIDRGAQREQVEAVQQKILACDSWQALHEDIVKLPDFHP